MQPCTCTIKNWVSVPWKGCDVPGRRWSAGRNEIEWFSAIVVFLERPWNVLCNRGCVRVYVYHCNNSKALHPRGSRSSPSAVSNFLVCVFQPCHGCGWMRHNSSVHSQFTPSSTLFSHVFSLSWYFQSRDLMVTHPHLLTLCECVLGYGKDFWLNFQNRRKRVFQM